MKWLFLVLWFVCVVAFTVGQLLAPPGYHLIPNNSWGSLFGISVVLGMGFFVLAVVTFVEDFVRQKNDSKKTNSKNIRYDLSVKRVVSRIILTGIVGIIFSVAILPFQNTNSDNGFVLSQQASIGDENMLRTVLLWGIYTFTLSLYTFWKKRFRMVSIFLGICWIIGLVFYLSLKMFDANYYRCDRHSPYLMPSEFNRALGLISQRTGVDSTGSNTIWQTIFNFRNCLDIQYSDTNNEEIEAYFQYPSERSQSNLQDLKIIVNPAYKNFDDLTLATLLSHEIIHAGQYINEVITKDSLPCYEREARAFAAQHAFILSLNQEEQRSIYTRLQDDVSKNPTIAILLLTGELGDEAAQSCIELQKKNNLTDEQTNKCSWEALESKLLNNIQEDPYYQKQCFGQQ